MSRAARLPDDSNYHRSQAGAFVLARKRTQLFRVPNLLRVYVFACNYTKPTTTPGRPVADGTKSCARDAAVCPTTKVQLKFRGVI